MATLEKIRSKSVILFIVIIVALLAFILGDFLTSSRSLTGPGTTAAKVEGHKVDIQEFNRRVEQQRQQMQAQGYANVDNAQLQNQVLQQMLFETMMDAKVKELGITVTDDELSRAMTGANPLPMVVQQVRQMGINSPAEFYDYAFNPGKYQVPAQTATQLQQAWVSLENQTTESLKQQKLGNLFNGALNVNKLDAKSYYDENATTAKIAYVKKDFATVPDSVAKIGSEDLKKIYNERKGHYKLAEETRPIDYIAVDIVPSADDLLAAQQEVEGALVSLREQPGTEGVGGNLNFVVNRVSAPRAGLPIALASQLDSLQKENVRLLSFRNNQYTIGKLVNTYNDVDTVTVELVAIVGNASVQDSVLTLLNGGVSVDSLIAKGLVGGTQPAQAVYVPQTGVLQETLVSAPLNVYVLPDATSGAEGGNAIKVTKRNSPVQFYDVAEITYTVDPSNATITKLHNDLQAYADTNNTAALFAANANVAGYHLFPAYVTPSSLSIANLSDTRGPAKWAMHAKKGQVSGVYGDEQSGHFLVVAVKDIYDQGYTPANDPNLSRELTNRALAQKKGEKLIADYSGKANDLAGYSQVMDSPVDTTEVTFGQRIVRGFPVGQSMLIAAASAAEPGQLTGPIATDNSVVVFQVVDEEKIGREFDQDNDGMMFNQQMGAPMLSRNVFAILLGKNKITNNLQKFYSE